MTTREMFEQIKGKLTDAEEIVFIEAQIAALDRKREKAQERRAEKKKLGDELRHTIQGILTDEFQSIADIVAAVIEKTGDDSFTNSKAIPRLSALCEAGIAVKEKVKTDAGDRTVYKLA